MQRIGQTRMCQIGIFYTVVWLKCWRRETAIELVMPRRIGIGAWTPVPT